MTLTLGTGPLAARGSTAELNFSLEDAPKHRIVFQPDPRRLRAVVGETVVLDTVRAHLLHESQMLPRIYAPLEDYLASALTPTETSTHCPFKGDANYWTVAADGKEIVDGLWGYAEPTQAAPFLKGFASLYEDKVDAWFVEEDRVVGHLKDPYHRVDAHPSTREVVVRIGGEEVARSPRPILVFETGLPVRAYVPPADVRPGAVSAGSDLRTVCPYKGEATYWTVGGVQDAAWSYESPLPDVLKAQGHLAFDDSLDGVEVTLT
ncbi:MAG: DUF427 domain-containing protein [Solirubrobacterales bacterium]|nr:DUF427 domain-containing protein [Solirubrobacterales bacterium]